jgi:hypothetical protein
MELAMKKCCLLFVSLLAVLFCSAQEIPLRKAWKLDWKNLQVKTTDNCAITLWEDTDAGDTDIYAQKINPSGVTQWATPFIIAGGPGVQEAIALDKTSDNNFILVYSQSGYGYPSGLWVQKFSSNGQRLWGDNGVQILSGYSYAYDAFVVPNTTGGAYISYLTLGSPHTVMGQHLDSYGNQLWTSGGIALASHSNPIQLDGMVSDGAGGVIVNVHKSVNNVITSELIRYSSSGAVIGPNPLMPSLLFPGGRFSILRDAQGSYVLWNFKSDPYSGLTMRKIDNQGNLLHPSSVVFNLSFGSSYANTPMLQPLADGGLMLSYATGSLNGYKLMLFRIGSNYEILWDAPGIQVATPDNSELYGFTASLTPDGGAWLTWLEVQHYPGSRLMKAQYVSPTGDVLWGADGFTLGTPVRYANKPYPIAFGDRCLFVFAEEREMHNSICRIAYNTSGTALTAPEGVPLVRRLAGIAAMIETIAIQDKYLVFWSDSRNGWYNLYYQLCDSNMNPLLEPQGRCFGLPVEGHEGYFQFAKLANNKVAVLHRLESYPVTSLYELHLIDANGNLTYPGEGVQVTDTPNVYDIKMSASGNDVYFGWTETEAGNFRLMGQRISNGELMWGTSGKDLLGGYMAEWINIDSVTERYFCFRKTTENPDLSTTCVLRVNSDGEPETSWPSSGIVIHNYSTYEPVSQLQSLILGNDLIVFYRNVVDGTVVVQGLSSQGTLMWPEQSVVLPFYTNIWDAIVVEGTVLLVYSHSFDPQLLYLQKLDAQGNLLLGEYGVLITDNIQYSYDAQLVKFSSGAMACIWSGYYPQLNGYKDVYMRHISPSGQMIGSASTILCSAWLEQDNVKADAVGNTALIAWSDGRAGILDSEYFVSSIYATRIFSSPVSTDDTLSPTSNQPELYANFPNPFNPVTTIAFSLPESNVITLSVYNLKGQKVKTLVPNSAMPAGLHKVVWNGCDETGKPVGSGVYFYTLETTDHKSTKKMLLMK